MKYSERDLEVRGRRQQETSKEQESKEGSEKLRINNVQKEDDKLIMIKT